MIKLKKPRPKTRIVGVFDLALGSVESLRLESLGCFA